MTGLNGGQTSAEALAFFKAMERNTQVFVHLVSRNQYIGRFVEVKDDSHVVFCNSLNVETGCIEDRHLFSLMAVITATVLPLEES
jgi:hypothetical protein